MRSLSKEYLELEKNFPDRIVGIDADRGIDEIKVDIYEYIPEVMTFKECKELLKIGKNTFKQMLAVKRSDKVVFCKYTLKLT